MVEAAALARESLGKRIAGEIVLSNTPGQTIQKWRNMFKIPQRALADQMKVMPSVISDYENSRRKSPGIKVIKRIVEAMIDLDEKTGGRVIKEFSDFPSKAVLSDAVLDLKEFSAPSTIKDFCKTIGASLMTRTDLKENNIHGYTVIDSMKAIVDLHHTDMVKLYGLTNERALVFTGAKSGRSSMVALKMVNLRPGLVVLHGSDPGSLDELAKRIADVEGIPIAVIKAGSVDELIGDLKKSFGTK